MAMTFDRTTSLPPTTLAVAVDADAAVLTPPEGKLWVVFGLSYANQSATKAGKLDVGILPPGGVLGADTQYEVRDFSLPAGSRVSLLQKGERFVLRAGERIVHAFSNAGEAILRLNVLERDV